MPSVTIFALIIITCIILAIIAIVMAVVFMSKNKKKQKFSQSNLEKVYVENIYEDNDGCKIKIRDLSGKIEIYPIEKEAMGTLYTGDSCLIARKNGKLVSWKALFKEKPSFFNSSEGDGITMKVTAESPVFKMAISSSSNVRASLDEVLAYLDRMSENQTDNFIGLKSEDGSYLEISGTGKDDYLEIRFINGKKSYRMKKCLISMTKSMVRDFYAGHDLASSPGFVIEE